MSPRLTLAAGRNGAFAVLGFALWTYHALSKGYPGFSRRAVVVAVLFFLTFLVATAWQAASRVKNWSWRLSALVFLISFVGVCVSLVAGLHLLVRLRRG